MRTSSKERHDVREAAIPKGICVLLLFHGLTGCLAVSGRNFGKEEEQAHAEPLTANVAADTDLADSPSPLQLTLDWTVGMDGARPERDLGFEIVNEWDEEVEVTLEAFSDGGPKGMVSRSLGEVAVQPRSTRSHGVAVNLLPAQRTDGSVSTTISAIYTASDGVRRTFTLPSVWVTHEAGYRTAFIRGNAQEAKVNKAAKSLLDILDTSRGQGRAFNAENGKFEAVNAAPASGTQGWTRLVANTPELPHPEEITDSFDDLTTDEKGGWYKVCVYMPYAYVDAGYGEDYLNISPVYSAPARYWGAVLYDAFGNQIAGFLNSDGCTNYINLPNGTYGIIVTPSMGRSVSNGTLYAYVYPDDQDIAQWSGTLFFITGSGGYVNITLSNVADWNNAGVAISTAMYRQPTALRASTLRIYSNQSCPDYGEDVSCRSGNSLYLGTGYSGTRDSSWKFVVLHEFGHFMQDLMFGTQSHPYRTDTATVDCLCLHVEGSDGARAHCLQSREDIASAELEGFAHMFASDVLNNGDDNNCTFAYYKQFREGAGVPTLQPPVARSCLNQVRWMESHCLAADRGTEYDWMGFYWRLKNKTGNAYSYSDLENVYQGSCGGTCGGSDLVLWSSLQTSVNSLYGANTAKALYWTSTGDGHGVHH